jgi:hypothetical protein
MIPGESVEECIVRINKALQHKIVFNQMKCDVTVKVNGIMHIKIKVYLAPPP